jgi:LysM repeat protein
MKFKILLITVLLFTISTSLFAKPVTDSVGVKNNDGKKMILFKVKTGDTYYSIGRRYHIKPESLMKYNGKKKAALSIGAIVEVPTEIHQKKKKAALHLKKRPKKHQKKKKRTRRKRKRRNKKKRV